ncbi:histidine kinase [Actinoplanes sp. NPDC051851]|uniref:sensor histidine kinase n=1 Tax=Actinoplanes sp. NPDC051851 TaxID=3154753 RepID=UPI0034346DCE
MISTVTQRFRHAAVRHPLLLDTVFGLMLALPAVVAVTSHDRGAYTAKTVAATGVAVIAGLLLAVRRIWPTAVLAVATTVSVAYIAVLGEQPPALTFAQMVAVYTVATRVERKWMWWLGAAVAVPLYLVNVLGAGGDWWVPQNIGVIALVAMAVAVGDANNSRRAYIAEMEERARRAEQNRDDEARRRVVEERIRIARELHDVVTHHIAVINVQAGAARHILRRQPDAADTALVHIRNASDTVLRELASMVGVLRQADDQDPGTEPTRGLARLTALLDSVATAGLKVEYEQHGETRDLPAMVDLAAHRILQEALTNAHKHGTGTAKVTITYAPEKLSLEIINPIATPVTGGGYGLIGMRERVTAAGGTLSALRQPDHRFRVHAVLPAPKTKGQP